MSTAVDVAAWYAGTAFSAGFTSHLLAPTWETRQGGGRPTLCGEWRRGWLAVADWAVPSAFVPCAACARAAGIAPPGRHPLAEVAPIADPDEIHPAKMASPAGSAPKIWHLLHVIRRRRSSVTLAVCGEPRMRWREVDGAEHRPCPACALHLPGGARTPLVRLAPAAPRDGHRPVITTSVPAVVLATQLAHAALPAGWRPARRLSLPMTDGRGQLTYGLLSPDAERYIPRAQQQREQLYAASVGQMAFPAWAPLTYCTTH